MRLRPVERIASKLTVLMFLVLPGCPCDAVDKIADSAKAAAAAMTNATNVLDKGVSDIQSDNGSWSAIVQDTTNKLSASMDKLPADIQSTLRIEATQLADRSIAKGGVQFHAGVDFLARRAQQGLQRLVSILKKEPIPPLPPGFDTVSPEQVLLSADPDRRANVQLYGYDMDHPDHAGHVFTVRLLCEGGQVIPVPETRIGRTTHYECVINVAGTDFDQVLTRNRVAKIQVCWDGQPGGLPEVLIAQRPTPTPTTETRTIRVPNTGDFTYVPPHTRGNADFSTHDDKPMEVQVIVQTRREATRLMARTYMKAYEPRPDYTTAEGWSDWRSIYTADPGWTITAASPIGQTEYHQLITPKSGDAQGRVVVEEPAGEVIRRLEVFGDHPGDEAGTWTRVIATFNPVTVDVAHTVIR